MSRSFRDFSFNNYAALPFTPGAVMLPFGRRSFLSALVERFRAKPIDMGPNTDREAYHLSTGGREVTLIFSGMGSPATANALEKAAANGVKRLILFGPCGGTAEHIRVGDIIIPSEAVRGEGTSRYYAPAETRALPDRALHQGLLNSARVSGAPAIHTGVVYTTDASYRQGPEVYENTEWPIVAVDCECSAAFVIAQALGLSLAAIFFCTDNIRSADSVHHRRGGLENEIICRSFELVADIAIGAALNESPEPAI